MALKLGGLAVTLAIHATLVAAMLFAHRESPAQAAAPPRSFVAAKLVRLGKPRDPKHLPRLETAPPPIAPATPISPSMDPATARPATPAPRPDEAAKLADTFRQARLRALRMGQQFEEPEGLATGSVNGTATTEAQGDAYATAIDQAIRAVWRLPDLVRPEQLEGLVCEVFLRLAPDGRILEHRIVKPSGNRFLDASVVEALARVGALPPPPPDRLALIRQGLTIEFRP
ncbi:MAG: TonB family protein [Myxococcota bacterium]